MRVTARYCLVFVLLFPSSLFALPISFGINQADIPYSEIESKYFRIYHDARVPNEGRMTLEALEASRPVMEDWFQVKRQSVLPVISSAVTSGASFANIITDAIELQTLGQGDRDLFWHEYTHITMYLHLHNFLGPAGAIIHIPWMPAWFIEGLAEALSVSIGSSRQASLERYQALTDHWPTYDRLHSLYAKSEFVERGYGTSGAFVAWLLRKGYRSHNNFLPKFLKRFFSYSTPLYYPWSALPFSNFLPMDQALIDFFDKDGEELYLEYKRSAREYWKSVSGNKFILDPNTKRKHRSVRHARSLAIDGADVTLAFSDDDDNIYLKKLKFDDESGWFIGETKDSSYLPSEIDTTVFENKGDFTIGVAREATAQTRLVQT